MSGRFTKRSLIAILLCVVLFATMLPVVASAAKLPAPKMKKAVVVNTGIKITWKASDGASGYRVYRRSSTKDDWKAIADVTKRQYIDTNPASNATNYYMVRALNGSGKAKSKNSNTVSTQYFKAPTKVKTSVGEKSITVSWKSVKGAPMYKVERRAPGGKWKLLGTTRATSIVDSKPKYGKEYEYRVRVVASNKKTVLGPVSKTANAFFTQTAKISSLSNKNGHVLVQWKQVKGIAQYRLFRKTESGDWFTVTTQAGTTYTDTDVLNNVKYTYYVRGMNAAGEYVGPYDSKGKSITYFVSPTMVSCTHSGSNLLVKWEEVDGVSNYIIFRRIGSGGWERVGTSTSTSFTDKSMPSGTYCLYTVACADSAGNAISGHGVSTAGATSYMDMPVLLGISNNIGSIDISWRAVDKAQNYVIYRYVGDKIPKLTDWTKIDTTTGTTYNDTTTIQNNKKYWYTVAVRDAGDTEDLSMFNESPLSIVYYTPPTLVHAINEVGGVQVKWNKVDGASSYKIYRQTGSGAWTQIGTAPATDNTYLDTSVVSTGHYWYSVASVALNDSAYYTAAPNAKDTTFYGTPVATISNGNGYISVSWSSVDGISTYRIADKDENPIQTSTAREYTETGVTSGTIYQYKICSIDGGAKVSGWSNVKIMYLSRPGWNDWYSPSANKAYLNWKSVTGATKYEVQMKNYYASDSSWQVVATVSNKTEYTLSGLASGAHMCFRIVAISNGGSRSVASQEKDFSIQ